MRVSFHFSVAAGVRIGICLRKFEIQALADSLVQPLVISSFLPGETFNGNLASLRPMGSKECL